MIAIFHTTLILIFKLKCAYSCYLYWFNGLIANFQRDFNCSTLYLKINCIRITIYFFITRQELQCLIVITGIFFTLFQ